MEHKVSVCTCQLEFLYFVETKVATTSNESLDDEHKHNEDNLDDATKMTTNDYQKTSNNTQEDDDKI